MRKVPFGSTNIDTVDNTCRARKVTKDTVYAHNGYEWYVIPVSVEEAVEDNHYIKLAACYAEGESND